jgi:hypothetical protein
MVDCYVMYLKESHGAWNYTWMHCVYDGSSSSENLIAADLKIFLN